MFGYVRIRKEELRIREYYTYNRKYCGLCQMLGKKYGFIYRMILSYDVVFLMLVLENFDADCCNLSFRCPMNPLKKIDTEVSEKIAEYSAFINYYLAILKLEDDVLDENKLFKKMALKKLRRNSYYKCMVKEYGKEVDALYGMINNVNKLEKENASFDVLSNSFGNFFAEIFKVFFRLYKQDSVEIMNDKMYDMCFNLGKWIYIMDAYDDYIEDIKCGQFNLLRKMMEEDDSPEKLRVHKKIATINRILLLKMKHAFNQITWNKNGEIIGNVISYGCISTYSRILHRRYPKIEAEFIKINEKNN